MTGAFPSDPALPGLEVASDPSAMRDIFRARLIPLVDGLGEIRECVLSRVRYRRGDRCLLQYSLRLADPASGRERSQWVTGAIYADGRARATYLKLSARRPEREIPAGLRSFEPVGHISELNMLTQVFPYDHRLPALPALMGRTSPDLERLLLTQARFGEGRAVTWEVEPIRYRPRLGAVIRYRLLDGSRGEKRALYVKVYRDDTGEQTFRLHHLLHSRDRPDQAFEIDKPVAYLSEMRALVHNEAAGISLEEALLDDEGVAATARRVARVLAAFHSEPVVIARRYDLTEYLADLGRIEMLLAWVCPRLRREVKRIVRSVARGLDEAPPAQTHRDLKPAHVFLDGDRLRLIDIDGLAAADPMQDVAKLAVRLAIESVQPSGSRSYARETARTIIETYLDRVPRSWHGRLRYHYAAAMLDAAAGFFRNQQPGWRERAAELIEAAAADLNA